MFVANLVILAQICDELWRGQSEFPGILSQNGKNDLEGQGQWPLFSIPAESIPWCIFGANLVILSQICYELSCGQNKVYGQTYRGADTGKGNLERPRGNKNNQRFALLFLCEGNPSVSCGFLSQEVNNRETFVCHDVIGVTRGQHLPDLKDIWLATAGDETGNISFFKSTILPVT